MKIKKDDALYPKRKEDGSEEGGLSKREYFVASALAGLSSGDGTLNKNPKEVAHWAVLLADAIIDELNKGEP